MSTGTGSTGRPRPRPRASGRPFGVPDVPAVTERAVLGTGAVVLPLRQALLVAKAAATVDVLSGGRFGSVHPHRHRRARPADRRVDLAERRRLPQPSPSGSAAVETPRVAATHRQKPQATSPMQLDLTEDPPVAATPIRLGLRHRT
ncbi:LLM class flavin-dependent oxidoreductase [Streptomyces sparsogenes]|uniref:LLM class flavin-dependent oxidoreductase n=1 Tax=Streptomyces sparsogenes TaxID=67365 RepID=UPI00332D859A